MKKKYKLDFSRGMKSISIITNNDQTSIDNPDDQVGFQIEATEVEISELENLLHQIDLEDNDTFKIACVPLIQDDFLYAQAKKSDDALNNVYNLLYKLGTDQTKHKLETQFFYN